MKKFIVRNYETVEVDWCEKCNSEECLCYLTPYEYSDIDFRVESDGSDNLAMLDQDVILEVLNKPFHVVVENDEYAI